MQELTFEAETTATKTRGEEIDEFLTKVNAEKYVLLTWDKNGELRVGTENIPADDIPELMTWTFEKLHRHENKRKKRSENNVGNYGSKQMVEPSRN